MDYEYLGTELKYQLNITATGFSMTDDNFTVDIVRGPKRIHFDKADLVSDGEGHYFVCFDSTPLGVGVASIIGTAYVPDEDFSDGLRTEVKKAELVTLLAV